MTTPADELRDLIAAEQSHGLVDIKITLDDQAPVAADSVAASVAWALRMLREGRTTKVSAASFG